MIPLMDDGDPPAQPPIASVISKHHNLLKDAWNLHILNLSMYACKVSYNLFMGDKETPLQVLDPLQTTVWNLLNASRTTHQGSLKPLSRLLHHQSSIQPFQEYL